MTEACIDHGVRVSPCLLLDKLFLLLSTRKDLRLSRATVRWWCLAAWVCLQSDVESRAQAEVLGSSCSTWSRCTD